MKIQFKKTPEQIELIKLSASKDPVKSKEAQWALAALLRPVLQDILLQADTTAGLVDRFEYDEDSDPSFPIDPFRNYTEGDLTIWTQEVAGGLPRNHVQLPTDELKFKTYRLDSAISWDKKFVRKSRMGSEILAGFLTMLVQELLLKTHRNFWATLLTGLANAAHDVNGTSTKHIFRATTAGQFDMDELNYWFKLLRRLNQSWAFGSSTGTRGSLTDLFVSPEFMQKIRSMSYNPINTKGAAQIAPAADSGVIPLSELTSQKLWDTAGLSNFMGITLHELTELGVGFKYNTLFDEVAGSTAYTNRAGSGSAAFNGATEEIVIGMDRSQSKVLRPVEVSDPEDNPSTFTLRPDDQFESRSEIMGKYGCVQIGHMLLDTWGLSGFIM